MNIKIRPGKIKYFVQGNVVTAIVQDCENDLVNFTYEKRIFTDDYKELLLNKNYIGVAKCDSDDEFSLTSGKEIARHKAIRKYRHALVRTWNRYVISQIMGYNKILRALSEDMAYCDDKYDNTMRKYSGDNE